MKEIRIGCSGYFYFHWKGKFYPEDLNPSMFLEYYAKFFNTVEINSTFYKMPKKANLKRIYQVLPDNFDVSLKMYKLVTHIKRFEEVEEELKVFYDAIESIKDRIAYVLVQLPPSLKYSKEFLIKMMDQLDPYLSAYLHAFEFRHESWWNEETYKYLEDRNGIFVSVDSAKVPRDIIAINSRVYLRLHGRGTSYYKYDYTEEELQKIAQELLKSKAKSIHVYFNNDYSAYAPKNALRLKEIINTLQKPNH